MSNSDQNTLRAAWERHKAEDNYGDLDYDDIVRSMGVEIVKRKELGSYHGDIVYLVRQGQREGVLVVGYGSCSGCDALQAAMGDSDDIDSWLGDVEALRDQLQASILWPAEDRSLIDTLNQRIVESQTTHSGDWWLCDQEVLDTARRFAEEAR